MTPPKRQKQEQEKEIQQQAYESTITQQGDIFRKDSVTDVASLPLSGNNVDDHRIVESDGFVRKWNGIDWVFPTSSGGPTAVSHDSTLTGDGTPGNPLGVAQPFTQQSSVLTISGASVFEKGVEQAPRTLTGTTTRSTNPTYAITSTVFKRAGIAISTQAGDTTPRTFSETTSILDTITFSLEVTNSNSYTSTNSKTLTGVYPYFYGKVADTQPIANQALIDSGTKVVASSTGNITIDFNSLNNEYCWFAIPESSSAKDTWYVNALNNGTIGQPGDWFPTNTIISVDSPDGYWTAINYRIYIANYVSAVTDPVTFSTTGN